MKNNDDTLKGIKHFSKTRQPILCWASNPDDKTMELRLITDYHNGSFICQDDYLWAKIEIMDEKEIESFTKFYKYL